MSQKLIKIDKVENFTTTCIFFLLVNKRSTYSLPSQIGTFRNSFGVGCTYQMRGCKYPILVYTSPKEAQVFRLD